MKKILFLITLLCIVGCYDKPEQGSYTSSVVLPTLKTGDLVPQIYAREITVSGQKYIVVQCGRQVAICQAKEMK